MQRGISQKKASVPWTPPEESVHSTAVVCTRPSKPPPPSSGRAGHLPSCHQVTWPELVCTHSTVKLQLALTCSQGTHRNHLEPHPQQDQECSKAGAQWEMSHTAPLVHPTPGYPLTEGLLSSKQQTAKRLLSELKGHPSLSGVLRASNSACYWRCTCSLQSRLSGTLDWTTHHVRFANPGTVHFFPLSAQFK